jgi:hypothetical protein
LPQAEDFFKYQDDTIYKLVEEVDEETAEMLESLYSQPAVGTEEVFEEEEEE